MYSVVSTRRLRALHEGACPRECVLLRPTMNVVCVGLSLASCVVGWLSVAPVAGLGAWQSTRWAPTTTHAVRNIECPRGRTCFRVCRDSERNNSVALLVSRPTRAGTRYPISTTLSLTLRSPGPAAGPERQPNDAEPNDQERPLCLLLTAGLQVSIPSFTIGVLAERSRFHGTPPDTVASHDLSQWESVVCSARPLLASWLLLPWPPAPRPSTELLPSASPPTTQGRGYAAS